ncbi:hypothetical protein [Pendulispora albinea]|uniref:Uncharacterized protein n=1 Tax=Pendulispora albinea TaxID=2741071 RepID=A0ABZ2MD13_9BACT
MFHIQTEDSGVRHPHVITHLFMDGGRILKSVKKSYAEHLGSEGLEGVVRHMMKEQHKAMFIALRGGHFDHLVDAAEASPPTMRGSAPPVSKSPSSGPVPSGDRTDPPPAVQLKPDVSTSSPPPSSLPEEPARSGARTTAAEVQSASIAAPSEKGAEEQAAGEQAAGEQAVAKSRTEEQAAGEPAAGEPAVAKSRTEEQAAGEPAADESEAPARSETIPAGPPASAVDTVKVPASASPETIRVPGPPPSYGEAAASGGPPAGLELTLDIDALEGGAPIEVAPAAAEPSGDLAPSPFKKRADTFRFRPPGKETRATAALLSTSRQPGAPGMPVSASFSELAARSAEMGPRSSAAAAPPASGVAKSDSFASAPSSSRSPEAEKSNSPPPSSQPGRAPAPGYKPQGAPGSEGRYAPARPAAIFGHARPQQGSSIFGEDLISDKSLDEVILSYLAEDLETEKK